MAFVLFYTFGKCFRVHTKLIVGRNLTQTLLAQAQGNDSFIYRRVGLLRRINAQQREIFSAAHSFFANTHLDAFTSGGNRMHAGNRCSVIDDASHSAVESHHLSQPIEHNFFELG